eukprot:9359885-Pyramimonas_sp.AAC.1
MGLQDGPGVFQEGPKSAHRGPPNGCRRFRRTRSPPSRPNMALRWRKTAQEASKRSSRRPEEAKTIDFPW